MESNSKVEEYIANSADFAQPILNHVRGLVHMACPNVIETIKWGFPNFEYKGVFFSMAAFKSHCSLTFWKASLLTDDFKIFKEVSTSMGQLGMIKSLNDLPEDEVLLRYLKEAVLLNENGIKVNKNKSSKSTDINIPEYLEEALQKNNEANDHFKQFSPSKKREYIHWLNDAKSEATRVKRLQTAILWIAEGKEKNWKYKK